MRAAFTAFVCSVSLAGNALAQSCVDVERTAFLMGTALRVSACGPQRDQTIAAIEAGFAETARLERVLSSWQPESEVGRLNHARAHARVNLTPELAAFLTEADHWITETNHAFDPAIGALIDAWGFRTTPRIPSPAELAAARNATGWSQARVEGAAITRGPHGWWIDTGGFGKGAALRRIASILRERSVEHAVIDFGGQLQVIGRASELSIAHPFSRNQATTSLRVQDVSVATSSQSERYIESDGKRYGHVLDPRTGEPVPAWGSVTVVTQDALAADALSTALFVLGPKAALEWAERHPEVGVLVLEVEHGEVRAAWSRAMNQWIPEKSNADE